MTIFDCIPVATMSAMYQKTMTIREMQNELEKVDREIRDNWLAGEPTDKITMDYRAAIQRQLIEAKRRPAGMMRKGGR